MTAGARTYDMAGAKGAISVSFQLELANNERAAGPRNGIVKEQG